MPRFQALPRLPCFQALPGNATLEALPPFLPGGGRASRTAFLAKSQEREMQENFTLAAKLELGNAMEEAPASPFASTGSRSFQNAITKRELGNEAEAGAW